MGTGDRDETEGAKLRKLVRALRRRSSRVSLTVAEAGMIQRAIKRASNRLRGRKGAVVVGRRTVAFDGEMAFVFPGHPRVSTFVERLRKRGFMELVNNKPKVYVGQGVVVAAVVLFRNEIVAKRRWAEGVDDLVLSLLLRELEG